MQRSLVLLGASALTFSLGVSIAASAQPADVPMKLAFSALGDLSTYRTIATDTLTIVDNGDLSAARARIKDLETSWDKAESNLKSKDKTTWTMLDGAIDAALTDLRSPAPKSAICAASLKALIAKLDMVDKA